MEEQSWLSKMAVASANQTSGSILILCTYIVKYSSKYTISLNPPLLQSGECTEGWLVFLKIINKRKRLHSHYGFAPSPAAETS